MAGRKELAIAHRIVPRRLDYREETIFGRTAQTVGEQSLEIALDLQQRWGPVYMGLARSTATSLTRVCNRYERI